MHIVFVLLHKKGYLISKAVGIYKYVLLIISSLYNSIILMMKLVLFFTFLNYLLAIPNQNTYLVETDDEVFSLLSFFGCEISHISRNDR